jgi:hypothetical protein
MARGPAFALIVVELGLSDTRCNPIYRRDDFMPDLGESGMRKSLARTRTDAGNCSTVACWPSHRRVTSTICPSGNSRAS